MPIVTFLRKSVAPALAAFPHRALRRRREEGALATFVSFGANTQQAPGPHGVPVDPRLVRYRLQRSA